jgi:sigma-E factor negative regulatory protein RseB
MISSRKLAQLVFRAFLVVFLAAFAPNYASNCAEAADSLSAVETLNAMRQAMRDRTYRGIVSYTKDNQIDNMEVIHAVVDGVERERVVSLNGPMREVVRKGKIVQCYLPDAKSVVIDSQPTGKSSFVDLPDDFYRLTGLYSFIAGRHDRIAQRDALEINVVPLDDLRYARRIWIDTESKLPLKLELLGEDEAVLEQMSFSSLLFPDSVPPSELEPSSNPDSQSVRQSQNESLPIDSLHWTLQNVPTGFRIVSFTRMTQTPQNRPIDHLLLSDGLASISIYFDQVEGQLVVAHPSQAGAINSYARNIGNYLVTTMGEAPPKTVQAIANGLRLRNSP